jgi:creatinine amidohydrolase
MRPRFAPFALIVTLAALLLATAPFCPAQAASPEPPPTLQMRNLTWMEIKAAIDRGFTSVIVPSGGIEQNGPHMVLAKHDVIVTHAAEKIAAGIGTMLVAPTLSIVPEGDISPPSGNMRWPGTIGISEAAFEAVLDGVARSLRQAGFRTIIFIGDHGQSQASQARIAEKLTREWRREGVRVLQVNDYYDDAAQVKWLQSQGETTATIGEHAGIIDTAELMSIRPEAIRSEALKALPKPLAELGASGAPEKATPALGQALIAMRIEAATAKIRSLLGN